MKALIKKLKTIYWRILAILARYYYCDPSKEMKVIGVTGTNGKTTSTTLLYKVATAMGYKAGLIGTVENVIAGERRPATHTTPDSVSLTKLLAEMRDCGCEYVFMEVSSHSLEQKRVSQLKFSGAVFTNLTHDHLDYHKNFDNYFSAKKKLFKMLPKRAFALSNADDEWGTKMLEGIRANKKLYGFYGGDYRGKIEKLNFDGLEMDFNGTKIKSKLLGNFNAYNLLAVWSTCDLLGFDKERVKNILENIEPPKGRFEHFMSPNGVLVIVDYAHTPDALEKVLTVAQEIKPSGGKLIAVFGCGGDRDPMKRTKMGRIGASMADIAIFTSDNPRGEDPSRIIGDMMADLTSDQIQKVQTIPDRREAIKKAMSIAQKGDIILVAGKGHEDYQEIKGEKLHFSDREEFEKLFTKN